MSLPTAPAVGAAAPLTAAYCAERAAAAIHRAEESSLGGNRLGHRAGLHAADRWMGLAALMAQHIGTNRPREDDRSSSNGNGRH
jgi:hypothetical protein